MTLALSAPLSQIALAPGSAMTLSGLTWPHYQLLLDELGSDRATRLTYDAGVLEIRMPSHLHEIINRLLSKIIFALAEDMGIETVDLGSTTWNRPDLEKGIEPDSCFFIQNAAQVQGLNPQLPDQLPPDLAIEVDIANASDRKLSIYAALGVPELWLYRNGQIAILGLNGASYQDIEESSALPGVSARTLQDWIALRETTTDLAVIKTVRQWFVASHE